MGPIGGEPDGIDGRDIRSQIPGAYDAFAVDAPYIAGRSLLEFGRRVHAESADQLGVVTEPVAVEGHESAFGAEYQSAPYGHHVIVVVRREAVSAVVEIGPGHGPRLRIDGKTVQALEPVRHPYISIAILREMAAYVVISADAPSIGDVSPVYTQDEHTLVTRHKGVFRVIPESLDAPGPGYARYLGELCACAIIYSVVGTDEYAPVDCIHIPYLTAYDGARAGTLGPLQG